MGPSPTRQQPKARSKSCPYKDVRRDQPSDRWEARQYYPTATAERYGGSSSSPQPPPPGSQNHPQLRPVSPPLLTDSPPQEDGPEVSASPLRVAIPAASAQPFSFTQYLLSPTILPPWVYYGRNPIAPPCSYGLGFPYPPPPPPPSTHAMLPVVPPLPFPPPPANNVERWPYPAEPPGFERWGPGATSKAGPSQRPR